MCHVLLHVPDMCPNFGLLLTDPDITYNWNPKLFMRKPRTHASPHMPVMITCQFQVYTVAA